MTEPLPPVYAVHGAADRWLIVSVDDWSLAAGRTFARRTVLRDTGSAEVVSFLQPEIRKIPELGEACPTLDSATRVPT
jgi:hypothetical protein